MVFFGENFARSKTTDALERNDLRDSLELPRGYLYHSGYYVIDADRYEKAPKGKTIPEFRVTQSASLDGHIASVTVIPKTTVIEGRKVTDCTGPEAYLRIRGPEVH